MVVPGFVLSTIRATTVPSSSMRTATTSKLSATGRKGKPRDLYDSARGHALCYPPEKGTSLNSHSTFAIETSDLVKTFGDTRAVDGVDLAVPTGMVYGLLGPNGAGKTTVIRVLATLLRPDAGTARVFGCDVVREADAVRSRVSLTGQFASVDEDLTGLENLVLIARLLGYAQTRQGARERVARRLRPNRSSRPSGQEVLGRHAAPARHRGEHRRDAGPHVPRRADRRPGP